MAIKQSKKDKELITKAMIKRLKISIHNLTGADILLRKLQSNNNFHSDRIILHKAIDTAQRLIKEFNRRETT